MHAGEEGYDIEIRWRFKKQRGTLGADAPSFVVFAAAVLGSTALQALAKRVTVVEPGMMGGDELGQYPPGAAAVGAKSSFEDHQRVYRTRARMALVALPDAPALDVGVSISTHATLKSGAELAQIVPDPAARARVAPTGGACRPAVDATATR